MSKLVNRRKFVTQSALSAAGLMLSGKLFGSSLEDTKGITPGTGPIPGNSFNLMKEVMKYRKIDAHVHVNLGTSDVDIQKRYAEELMAFCDRFKV
ncbi:MAG TPA: amidohydrolase, partial [Sphingobacteriaceae bacterium]